MFGSGPETGHENSGAAGSPLIPVRFVWPYAGRRVFLSGSFTRWSEPMLMSPIEGCLSNYLQIDARYYQYKFFVDGEWRHDERQPFVTGDYGVANNVFIAREQDVVPTINHDVPDMEVDDVIMHQEAVMQIPEADLVVSRQRISLFLSTHTAYELLPDPGKVIALDVNLPVKQAFHILHEQGIPVAPLWDFCKGQFVGVLSALDFILILGELGTNGSNMTEEELETHTISAWKDGKSQLNRQIDGNGISHPGHLAHAGPYDSLKDVALKILQHKVATIPIINPSSQMVHFRSFYILLPLPEY
ncbi:hypothetical protein LWI29_016878 [Acer saccharum]|uniref:CBS domain-containing protein n=1 Tax=Acer saccharum TaxID=4024 RepID=A0AA39VVY0_ACESA|nr:hypothetical protein LWI29_016878 [Acer saccharum]